MTSKFKRFGRLVESINFLPCIHLSWYYYNGKRHYYWGASWLFWYFVSIKGFEWEKKEYNYDNEMVRGDV